MAYQKICGRKKYAELSLFAKEAPQEKTVVRTEKTYGLLSITLLRTNSIIVCMWE